MKVLVVPDTQVKPGQDFTFLNWIGRYAVDKRPDVIVHLGDFADMPSLSSHDKAGSKSMEGKRYKEDINAAHEAMKVLMQPIRDEQSRLKRNKEKQWKPRLVLTLGNHENRIDRAINNDPKLEGLIHTDDLRYREFGWEVVPFLKPVIIGGVAFCHYFPVGVMGRACGSAAKLLQSVHQSCVAGHQQGRQIAYGKRVTGEEMTAIIAGSCYPHNEDYMSHQSNQHWRGLFVLNDVRDGTFEEMPVSLKYLKERYAA
jgi:hypothetical protein